MNKIFTIIISLLIVVSNQLGAQQSDDTRVLDISLPVGSLPGNVDVSSTGSASYNIPIIIPKGIAGMEPSLTISYNSSSGDGTMGIGWGIAGAGSAIDRVTKSPQIDGVRGSVNYDNSDALAIDGQRLIPDALDPTLEWGNNKVFWLQGNPTTKGTFSAVSNSWTIVDPGGKTMIYGYTSESRLEKNGVTFRWLLKSVTDLNGNTMTYHYTKDNTDLEIYLSSIEYTSNGSNVAINKIEFVYDTRPSISKLRTNKGVFKSSVLLRALNIEVSGQLAWKYRFNYAQSEMGISYLSEVIKEDGAGKDLNSTRLQWELPKKEITHLAAQSCGNEYLSYSGDFNGDGIMDLLDSQNQILYGTTSGLFNTVSIANLGAKAVGDFDNDGITEVVNYDNKIYKVNSNNTLQYVKTLPSTNEFVVADYNQDGILDFIFEGGDVYSFDNLALIAHTSLPTSIFEGIQGDVDGDGDIEYINVTGELGKTVNVDGFSHAQDIYNNVVAISNKMTVFNKSYSQITSADCNAFHNNIVANINTIISDARQDSFNQYSYDVEYLSDEIIGLASTLFSYTYEYDEGVGYWDFIGDLNIMQSNLSQIVNIIQTPPVTTTTTVDTRVYDNYHFDRTNNSYSLKESHSLQGNDLIGTWASNGDGFQNLQFTNIDWDNITIDNPIQLTAILMAMVRRIR